MHWSTGTTSKRLLLTKLLNGCTIIGHDKGKIRYYLHVNIKQMTACEEGLPLLTPATMSLSTEIIVDLSTGSANHGSTSRAARRSESIPMRPLEVTFLELAVRRWFMGHFYNESTMLTGMLSR
jgi:hypothetical protein